MSILEHNSLGLGSVVLSSQGLSGVQQGRSSTAQALCLKHVMANQGELTTTLYSSADRSAKLSGKGNQHQLRTRLSGGLTEPPSKCVYWWQLGGPDQASITLLARLVAGRVLTEPTPATHAW